MKATLKLEWMRSDLTQVTLCNCGKQDKAIFHELSCPSTGSITIRLLFHHRTRENSPPEGKAKQRVKQKHKSLLFLAPGVRKIKSKGFFNEA